MATTIKRQRLVSPYLVLTCVILTGASSLARSDGSELRSCAISGGGGIAVGGGYELRGTIGQPIAATSNGADLTLTGGFWFPIAAGDGNGDGVVNLADYDVFEGCLAGPGGGTPQDQCSCFDTDGSGVIDLRDFAAVQATFTGSPR